MPPSLDTTGSETVPEVAAATAAEPRQEDRRPERRGAGRIALDAAVRHSILLLTIVLFIVFTIAEPQTFPTLNNLRGIALNQSVAALLALAVLIVIVTGEFDLSVGYVLGFTAVLAASLGGKSGLAGPLVLVLVLAAGAAIGLISGTLVSRFRINSLIATLGIGLAISGLSVGVSGGQTLSGGIPHTFVDITRTKVLGLEMIVWIVLAVALAMYLLLVRTPLGRKMYATGGSERVARMVGIRTRVLKVSAFVAAGMIAALAGCLQLGLSGAANPSFGSNLLLPAFAAVFLGSTTVRPGYFNVWGTILAIVLLAIGFSGLSLMGVAFWVEPVFQGVALIIGVLLSRSETRAALADN